MSQIPEVLDQPMLLRAEDVSKLLSLGRSTVFQLLASGELPVVRIGRAVRVRRADLEPWIEAQTTRSGQSLTDADTNS